MSRLRTIGCELGLGTSADGNNDFDGFAIGTVAVDNVVNRSPGGCYKCSSGAGNSTALFCMTQIAGSGTTTFQRVYMRMDAYPAGTVRILWLNNTGSGTTELVAIKITSAGVLQLWNLVSNTQVGSNGPTVDLNQWFMLELGYTGSATGTGYIEARYQGVSFASTTTATTNTNAPKNLFAGWADVPGANKNIWVDDAAINNNSGTSQNTWPGPGHVIYLRPVSDNARVGWTNGAAGTTGLWDALNNSPPTGVAGASSTATSQIKDKANNVTDAYTANMTDYTTAGLPSDGTVVVVQPVVNVGQDSATSTSFTYLIVTNPVGANNTATGTSVAAGTWPTAWSPGSAPTNRWGTALVSPSITPGTQPTMRVVKATSSSTITQMVDGMAIAVEYTAPSDDAATATVSFTPSASESTQSVDSDTLLLNVDPAASVEAMQTVDSDTEILALVPSGSDVYTAGGATYVDSGTESLALTASGTDQAGFTDSDSESLGLVPSSADTAQFTESNSEVFVLTPTASEIQASQDSATEGLSLSASATELREISDSSTETFLLQASAVETAQYVESNSQYVALSPSALEEHTTYDTATENLVFAPAASESADFSDVATESLLLSPTQSDILAATEAASGILALSPSDVETIATIDSDTEVLALSPTSADVASLVDSNTEPLNLVPSANESSSGQTNDAATESLSLSPTALDQGAFVDAATESLSFSVSADEVSQFIDAAAERLVLSVLSTDIADSAESGTVTITTNPSAADQADFIDSAVEQLLFVIDSTELHEISDSDTENFTFEPGSTDIVDTAETDQAILSLVPSGTDEHITLGEDIGTLYLSLTSTAIEIYKAIELVGIAYKRYYAVAVKRFSINAFRRWWYAAGKN